MPRFGLTPKKEAELEARMARLDIREEDLVERFLHGGGAGGQKVNKTASMVQLTHTPTGVEVRCQKTRSQAQNRFFARRRLCEQLEAEQLGEKSPEAMRRAKLRKQKKRRKRRSLSKGEG